MYVYIYIYIYVYIYIYIYRYIGEGGEAGAPRAEVVEAPMEAIVDARAGQTSLPALRSLARNRAALFSVSARPPDRKECSESHCLAWKRG